MGNEKGFIFLLMPQLYIVKYPYRLFLQLYSQFFFLCKFHGGLPHQKYLLFIHDYRSLVFSASVLRNPYR